MHLSVYKKKYEKIKNHARTDDFLPKKVSAHKQIPLWNIKKSTLTIF